MDLAKAKGVIIIILVAFNVFLLFNNLTVSREQGVRKETIENAEKILKARGVTLEKGIPPALKEAHWLVYGNEKLDRPSIGRAFFADNYHASGYITDYAYQDKKLVFTSDTGFVYTDGSPEVKVEADSSGNVNSDEAQKIARKYLNDHKLLSGRYVIDELRRESDGSMVVTFMEEYDDFLVYDNYCSVTVTTGGVTRLEYSKLQILGFSKKIDDLADAYQVLLANYKDGSSLVITDMDVGYRFTQEHSIEGMESTELLPIWRVRIKGVAEPVYLGLLDAED